MDIIIDTDIGDDIDDAFALALCLNTLSIHVLAISTVFKNTQKRCQIAELILKDYDKGEIPLFAGQEQPVKNKVSFDVLPGQFSILEEWVDQSKKYEDACTNLIPILKENPDAKIMAIGPLTNIAKLCQIAPELMKNRELIMMGGMFCETFPEWNIVCDPEAAEIVLNSDMKITMIGLDVTLKCRLTDEELKRFILKDKKRKGCLSILTEKWMAESKHNPILHDPLVAGYLMNPSLLAFEEGGVVVETEGIYTRGMTVNRKDVFGHKPLNRVNCQIAKTVKRDEFIKLFFNNIFN